MTLRKSGHGSLAGGPIMLRKGWPHHPAKTAARWPHDPANRQRSYRIPPGHRDGVSQSRRPDLHRAHDPSLAQVRHALRSAGGRKRDERDLRATSEPAALRALEAYEQQWGARYPGAINVWRARWSEVVPFLDYPPELRRILYTTNAIESLNFQLRKVIRPKGHFPNEQSVLKILYLAIAQAKMKWKMAPEWPRARAHFAIVFAERLPA